MQQANRKVKRVARSAAAIYTKHQAKQHTANRKVNFSIKAKEIAEEKEAVQQYGSSVSGASLGDILSVAMNKEDKD